MVKKISAAISSGIWVVIKYLNLKGETSIRKVKPKRLSSDLSLVEGYCYLRKEERSFNLKRIAKLWLVGKVNFVPANWYYSNWEFLIEDLIFGGGEPYKDYKRLSFQYKEKTIWMSTQSAEGKSQYATAVKLDKLKATDIIWGYYFTEAKQIKWLFKAVRKDEKTYVTEVKNKI